MKSGLAVEVWHHQYGHYTLYLDLPDWWENWERIRLLDHRYNTVIGEVAHSQWVDRLAALEAKIEHLTELLEKQNALG